MATVKFPSEMPAASDVGGNDKLMISKDGSGEAFQVSFNAVKEYLEITDIELSPVQGGATEAEATPLPSAPAGQNRKMDASPGWYSVNGVPVEATSGHVWKWFWNGTAWSLVDMGELPQAPADGDIIKNETKAVNGDRVFTYLQGLVVGNSEVIQTTLAAGTFNQTLGVVNDSVNWLRTLPYPQKPNTLYVLNGIGATTNDANAQRVAFYRPDGSYIGFLPSPGATNSFEYTTPADCATAIAVVDAAPNIGADVPNSPYQQTFSVTPIEIEEPKLVAEKIRGKIETEQVQLLDSALVHDNNNFKEKFDFTEGVSVLPYKKIALPSSSGVNHLNFAVTKENDVSIISTKIDFITTGGSIRLGFGDKNACFQFVKTQSSNSIVDVYEMSRFGINVSGSGVFIPATALSEGDFITLIRSGLLVYLYINGEYVGYKDLSNVGRLSGHLGGVIGIRDNVATWVATDINYKKRPAPYMHLSVDDCITSFQWIAQNSPTSIFEDARFAVYKEMHDKYGACISIYCFYETSGGSFNLTQMPDTYKQEFIDNSDWLKIGFHGVDSTTNYTTIDTTTGVEHYNRIVNEIYRFAGYSSIDNMPRFSMFKGNNDLFTELKEYGLVGVLTADDTRTDNSGLSTSERTALGLCDDYYNFSREFYYIKSEWRLDTTNATQVIEQLETLYKSQNNRNIYEMFWHQGREINSDGKEMIEAMCQWAVEKGIRFDFPQHNIFGK